MGIVGSRMMAAIALCCAAFALCLRRVCAGFAPHLRCNRAAIKLQASLIFAPIGKHTGLDHYGQLILRGNEIAGGGVESYTEYKDPVVLVEDQALEWSDMHTTEGKEGKERKVCVYLVMQRVESVRGGRLGDSKDGKKKKERGM